MSDYDHDDYDIGNEHGPECYKRMREQAIGDTVSKYPGADPELLGEAIDILKAENEKLKADAAEYLADTDLALENAHRIIGQYEKDFALKNAALREGLRKLEWSGVTVSGIPKCPACHALKLTDDNAHYSDCWLAKLLEGK